MPDSRTGSVLDDLFDPLGSDLIRDIDGARSRAEVLDRARLVASGLNGCNLIPGDRVAILCASPAEAITGFLAVLLTPYCAVPIHPATPSAAIGQVLADSGARALLVDRAGDSLEPDLAALPQVDMASITTAGDMTARRLNPKPDDLAAILYTSGTSGAPKGVRISFANIESMTDQLVKDFFRVDRNDTLLMAAPLSNIYGLSLLMVALRARATLSIPVDLRPEHLLETLRRDRVSFVAGVPALASILLRATRDAEDPLPHLRRALLAGTRLDPALAREFAEKFDTEVISGYAMTEAVPIAMALDLARLPEGLVGTIARDIELQIVDSGMNPLEAGQEGEILIRGPAVTDGYWQAAEISAQSFHDGWFRTGDVGRLDKDGHLQFIDRVKDIIKTSGNTVYPSEVESVLKEHPGIQDVAVVGAPHASLGELVIAYFVAHDGQTIDATALKTFCKDRLISWKVPRRFMPVEVLPRTASGKISKFRLRPSDSGRA